MSRLFPTPWSIVQPDKWPYNVSIVDRDGKVFLIVGLYEVSTKYKTREQANAVECNRECLENAHMIVEAGNKKWGSK